MTQYNNLNIELSNSQLNKLKLRKINRNEVALKISAKFVGDFYDDNNFLHILLLTNTRYEAL